MLWLTAVNSLFAAVTGEPVDQAHPLIVVSARHAPKACVWLLVAMAHTVLHVPNCSTQQLMTTCRSASTQLLRSTAQAL